LTGATVDVHELTSDGQPGKLLATTTTDKDGYYQVSVERGSSTRLLVTTSGGSYVDSATGKSRSAGKDGSLQTVVLPNDHYASVTPLTTWATARASWLAGEGTAVDTAVEVSFAATAREFNVGTITEIDPAIIDDPTDVQVAGVTSRQLGLILAGLDAEAKALGVTPLGLTDAVAADLSDGALDGKNASASVLIDGKVSLPADAATAKLQDAINKVAASAANKTHLPAPQIDPQAPELETAAGSLYVMTTALPVWIDRQPGRATIEARAGTAPYTCELAAGALPKGFSLSSGCVLSGDGTPILGTSTMWVSPAFTVRVSDASQPPHSVSVDLRITVVEKSPTITTSGGKCPQAGKLCSITVATAKGGTPPYYFTSDTFANGTPPLGMIVNLKGVLTGKPARDGKYTFGVCVVDLVGFEDCAPVTVTVGPASQKPSQELPSSQQLPAGFPTNLPAGTYHVSACTSVQGFTTCVDGGDFTVSAGDESDLAEALAEMADQIRSACACSVHYTAWNGKEFDLVISDPAGGVTTLRVTKVG
jgi:hypothetical protein